MKAVAYREPLPITDPNALLDMELPDPRPGGHDLLVQVEAVVHHSMGDIPVTSKLSDYKEVDGIKIPFTNSSSMMGQEQAIALQSVEHNVEIPADRFAVPAEVEELLEIPEATRAED